MTTQQQIDFIRQKCIEANPEINSGQFLQEWSIEEINTNPRVAVVRPIRLADVLLAIGKKTTHDFGYYCCDNGVIAQTGSGAKANWNLRKDDLTEQSDECIIFLADLLQ